MVSEPYHSVMIITIIILRLITGNLLLPQQWFDFLFTISWQTIKKKILRANINHGQHSHLIIRSLLWRVHLRIIRQWCWTHWQTLSKLWRHHVDIQFVNISISQDSTGISAGGWSGSYGRWWRWLHSDSGRPLNMCLWSGSCHWLMMLLCMTSLLKFLLHIIITTRQKQLN